MTISTTIDTFGDVQSIVFARTKADSRRDTDLVKGFINEVNSSIFGMARWPWAKMDRSFVIDVPETDGTVSVTEDSREVTFSDLQLDVGYYGKSLAFGSESTLYRIIGINTSGLLHKAYLDAAYVGSTNATQTFNVYTYEFPVPPDCDSIEQVYIDTNYIDYGRTSGQIDGIENSQFNRILSTSSLEEGIPRFWCQDGRIQFNNIPPLDEMILDYDFLGGSTTERLAERIRIYPIASDVKRVIKLSYSLNSQTLTDDSQKIIIPKKYRWILVHGANAEYLYFNDRKDEALREELKARKMLLDMSTEYKVTAPKPRMIYDPTRHRRFHNTPASRRRDLFWASRQREND